MRATKRELRDAWFAGRVGGVYLESLSTRWRSKVKTRPLSDRELYEFQKLCDAFERGFLKYEESVGIRLRSPK